MGVWNKISFCGDDDDNDDVDDDDNDDVDDDDKPTMQKKGLKRCTKTEKQRSCVTSLIGDMLHVTRWLRFCVAHATRRKHEHFIHFTPCLEKAAMAFCELYALFQRRFDGFYDDDDNDDVDNDNDDNDDDDDSDDDNDDCDDDGDDDNDNDDDYYSSELLDVHFPSHNTPETNLVRTVGDYLLLSLTFFIRMAKDVFCVVHSSPIRFLSF